MQQMVRHWRYLQAALATELGLAVVVLSQHMHIYVFYRCLCHVTAASGAAYGDR